MTEDLEKLVNEICNMTVLELVTLLRALEDKFGLGTSVKVRENANKDTESEAELEAVEEESPEGANPEAVKEESAEDPKEQTKPEEESKPAPDPSDVEVPNEVEESVDESIIKEPIVDDEDENYDLVYAWRYSEDNRYAKIGISTKKGLPNRMPGTYHPTYTPKLIGIYKCTNRQHAEAVESDLLRKLKKTRPDREWVEIDEAFNEMIEKSFDKPENAD